jgi:hypothetical protein
VKITSERFIPIHHSMRFPASILALLLGIVSLRADDVPVAPIAPELSPGGEPRFHLRSEKLQLCIDPIAGNLLSLSESLSGEMLPRPVSLLPPGLELPPNSTPWESRGWKTSDGAQVIMLHRRLAAPLSYALSMLVNLSPEGNRLSITTRVTALAASPERPLPLGFAWPLTDNEALWTHSLERDGCAGWAQHAEPTTSRIAAFARQYEGHLLLLHWRQELEDGPVLDSGFLRIAPADGESSALLLSSAPSLPPQGWTLVSELRIDLLPLNETDTPCKRLESLQPADGG